MLIFENPLFHTGEVKGNEKTNILGTTTYQTYAVSI